MRRTTRRGPRAGCAYLLASSVLVCVGCGGAQFGSELSAHPQPRLIEKPARTTLRVPQDEPFAIALPRSAREGGLDGTADGDATADPAGSATATASVKFSGMSESLFQLGHSFANGTDQQMDLDVTAHFHSTYRVHAEPDAQLPDALVGLRLYVRDSRGRMLRDLVLLDQTTENGATQSEADQSPRFTITLAPGESADVYVAGLAKVDIPTGRTATAELSLSGLQLEVVTQPAPLVPAASHERQ